MLLLITPKTETTITEKKASAWLLVYLILQTGRGVDAYIWIVTAIWKLMLTDPNCRSVLCCFRFCRRLICIPIYMFRLCVSLFDSSTSVQYGWLPLRYKTAENHCFCDVTET